MKVFDLKAAELGEPIRCCGTQAKFVAYEPEAAPYEQVIYLAHGNQIFTSAVDGLSFKHRLTMAPKKRTVWVNLFLKHDGNERVYHYASKEGADKDAKVFTDAGLTRVGGKAYSIEIEVLK